MIKNVYLKVLIKKKYSKLRPEFVGKLDSGIAWIFFTLWKIPGILDSFMEATGIKAARSSTEDTGMSYT